LLPLLEATLVQDVPQEPVYIYVNTNPCKGPVYNASPMPAPEVIVINNETSGWSRISLKLRVVILGLVLVAVALVIVVAVVVAGNGDTPPAPILTSTTIAATVLTSTTTTVSE